ncbi:NAD-dependent epimerase/dehydratase family protein [Pseudenhygromyxa sp. WMMC2535]|uniref:NAD-dependent epimerase/dehydratase family protein n=1 Tax=Pseudenhygromyxa sp. WMMC2535 TaxID=2712867 RepID=UPI0015563822|nr:NAD-dependent epimerase/dehydratase family protein [Pseudenhygromyxa sp. WMMC2535]NVB40744.1 NAD-dependent epimerase/dehydratase family protein [Pseudenhygromyxa sp. WMMC2535]
MTGTRALVTGGGGFVGRGIVSALLREGCAVRSLTRSDYPELAAAGVETFRGDVADAEAVRRAVAGCGLVFHVAAKVGAAGAYEDFQRTNVLGTQNVLDACRSEGAGRLVFTSTPSVVFSHEDLEGVDESQPYPDHYDAFYPQTKAEAERMVLAANAPELRTLSLRPHIVWGPGDTSLLPRLRARAAKLKRIVTPGPAKKMDITFIDDAVAAHLAAARALAERPELVGGKAYFISSGEPVEIWPFIDAVLEATGMQPVRGSAPRAVAMAAGWVFEVVHGLRGAPGEPRMSRWIVRELTTSHWFDISAARRELGYVPQVSLEDGLARLAESGDWG